VRKIPVVFGEAWLKMKKSIEQLKPDIILSFGLARKRADITIEKVAINVIDAKQKDNKGNKPVDEPIAKDGKEAYFSPIPPRFLAKELYEVKIPSSISYTAGTFLCNYLMYKTLSYIEENGLGILFSYIHLPYLHEQVLDKSMPSMSFETLKSAVEVIIKSSISYKKQNLAH
jgi:pyroglutamyl-peptidase